MKNLIIFLILPLILSCNNSNDVISLHSTSNIIDLPDGDYRDVLWLDSDVIAFIYFEQPNAQLSDYNIYSYNLRNETVDNLQKPISEECGEIRPLLLRKRNKDNLLVFGDCVLNVNGVPLSQYSLWEWSNENKIWNLILNYPVNSNVASVDFAPNGLKYAEYISGSGSLEGKFYINETKNNQRDESGILLDYVRVRSPSWSPDGGSLAFMGNKSFTKSYLFSSPLSSKDIVMYPWNLEIINMKTGNITEVISSIRYGTRVIWLSKIDTDYISFSGEYKDIEGIFVVDMPRNLIYNIWHEQTDYSWSPDYNRIIVSSISEENQSEDFPLNHLMIINIDLP